MIEGDMLRFAGAVASLVSIGVFMGFSPLLVAVSLGLLARVKRAIRALTFLLLGLIIGATFILLVLQVFDPRSLQAVLSNDVEKLAVRSSVDLTAGTLFLIVAVIMWLRLKKPPRPKKPPKELQGKPWEMTLIGFSDTVFAFSGFATMYVVARILRSISDDAAVRVLAYAIFVIAMVAPYVLLAWAWKRFPTISSAIVRFFSRVAAADYRPWAAGVTLLIGAIFVGLGFWEAVKS